MHINPPPESLVEKLTRENHTHSNPISDPNKPLAIYVSRLTIIQPPHTHLEQIPYYNYYTNACRLRLHSILSSSVN